MIRAFPSLVAMMLFVLSSSTMSTTSSSISAQSESLTLSGAISTVAGMVNNPPGFTGYGIAATLWFERSRIG